MVSVGCVGVSSVLSSVEHCLPPQSARGLGDILNSGEIMVLHDNPLSCNSVKLLRAVELIHLSCWFALITQLAWSTVELESVLFLQIYFNTSQQRGTSYTQGIEQMVTSCTVEKKPSTLRTFIDNGTHVHLSGHILQLPRHGWFFITLIFHIEKKQTKEGDQSLEGYQLELVFVENRDFTTYFLFVVQNFI